MANPAGGGGRAATGAVSAAAVAAVAGGCCVAQGRGCLSHRCCGRKPSQQRLRGGLRDIALLLLLLAGAVAVVVAASIMVLVLAVWPVQVVVAVLLATQRLSGRQLRSTRQGALDD